jgi:hypothetical protein
MSRDIFELAEAAARQRAEWPERLTEAASKLSGVLGVAGLGIPYMAKIEIAGKEKRAFGWYVQQIARGVMTAEQAIKDAKVRGITRISTRSRRAGFQRILTPEEKEQRVQKRQRYLQNREARRLADRERTLAKGTRRKK